MKIGKIAIPIETMARLGREKYRAIFGEAKILASSINEYGHLEFVLICDKFDDFEELKAGNVTNENYTIKNEEGNEYVYYFRNIPYYIIDIMETPVTVRFMKGGDEDDTRH